MLRIPVSDRVRKSAQRSRKGLFTEQIKLIYDNALASTLAILTVTILAWIGLDGAISDQLLNLWAGYMLFVGLSRLALYLAYKKRFRTKQLRTWTSLIIGSAMLAGIGWAGLSLFAFAAEDTGHKIVIVMIVLGIMAASVPVLSALLPAFFSASLPPAITLLVALHHWQIAGKSLLLVALAIYTALVIYTAFTTNRNLLHTLRLQRDNRLLIKKLSSEITDREQAQGQLEEHRRDLEIIVDERTRQLTHINSELENEITVRLESENKLRESHDRFTAVLNTLDASVYVSDPETHEVLFMNKNAIARWGEHVGDTCWKMIQPGATGPCEFCTNNFLVDDKGKPCGIHSWERLDATSGQWLECRDQAIQWPDGRLVRMQIATNITERVMSERRILTEHQFLQTIIDGVADPIMVIDNDYNIKLTNKAAEESPLFASPAANRKCFEVNHDNTEPCSNQDHICPLVMVKKTQQPVTVIHRHKTPDGKERLFEVVGTPLFDEQHNINGMVQASRDITAHIHTQQELQEKKNRLEHVAYHDNLTSLPNRTLLADRLNQAMAQVNRRSGQLAVAYLDLDGFKEINDHYGHETGDLFLVAVAHRVRDMLREGDTIARLGGDEFVAVLVDLQEPKDSTPLLERMLSAVAQPVHLGKLSLKVSGSIGVTFYPQADDVDADQLLRQADQAMYTAKMTGKNRYHLFEGEQIFGSNSSRKTLADIKQGLQTEQFVLHYQPKVNMRSGEIVGAEALIRWHHPSRGLIPPGEFLPLIENRQLAVTLDEWVLDSALSQIEQWQSKGTSLRLSINIGARLLQKSNFVEILNKHLQAHPQVDPGQLELEVLETSALEDMAQVSEVIKRCRDMGVYFALDDFGTGYSSLTYLKLLPAAFLKIDQSFVRDMLDDPEDLAILEGVLGLATAFSREAIAEGVESVEHGQLLLQLGCEVAQGFAIAKPMPADELVSWISNWKPDPRWTQQKEVPHEDLPLLFAAVEHRAWIRQVEQCILGQTVPDLYLDVHDCRFGKWLRGAGHKQYSQHPAFSDVEKLHQQVHNLATTLCAMRESYDEHTMQSNLKTLNGLRDSLTSKLHSLI